MSVVWGIEFNDAAHKKVKRLPKVAQSRILSYLEQRIEGLEDPRIFGKALSGQPHGRWRYRVGDYRIICRLDDASQTIIVLEVGHRREVYR